LRQQFADGLDDWQEGQLRRIAELTYLASEGRSALLQGVSGITIADLVRLETCAGEALAALRLAPVAKAKGPSSIELHLVRPDDTVLSRQFDTLKSKVAELEGKLRASENATKEARQDAQELLQAAKAAPPPQPSVFTPCAVVPQSGGSCGPVAIYSAATGTVCLSGDGYAAARRFDLLLSAEASRGVRRGPPEADGPRSWR
jgi:hypothetical protein